MFSVVGSQLNINIPKSILSFFLSHFIVSFSIPEVQSQYRVMVQTESEDSESTISTVSDISGKQISDAESFQEIPMIAKTSAKTSPESSPDSTRRKNADKSVTKLAKYQAKTSPDFMNDPSITSGPQKWVSYDGTGPPFQEPSHNYRPFQ